jgi:hypothetical protein
MKKAIFHSLLLGFIIFLEGCMEQNQPIWEGAFVEFQTAVINAPVPGEIYPRILVSNSVGTVDLQVNLVAAQRSIDEVISYRVVPEGTTAQEGTDFEVSGTLIIPANESTGNLEVEIINSGVSGESIDILFELEGNENIQANPNYKQVQIRINRP